MNSASPAPVAARPSSRRGSRKVTEWLKGWWAVGEQVNGQVAVLIGSSGLQKILEVPRSDCWIGFRRAVAGFLGFASMGSSFQRVPMCVGGLEGAERLDCVPRVFEGSPKGCGGWVVTDCAVPYAENTAGLLERHSALADSGSARWA